MAIWQATAIAVLFAAALHFAAAPCAAAYTTGEFSGEYAERLELYCGSTVTDATLMQGAGVRTSPPPTRAAR